MGLLLWSLFFYYIRRGSNVEFDGVLDSYSYEVGFLLAGSYTLAVTCNAGLDDENDNSDIVLFDAATDVDVVAGENTDSPLVASPAS